MQRRNSPTRPADKLKVFLWTSFLWSIVLFVLLVLFIIFYPSKCETNKILKSALCSIGQALTRNCNKESSFENVQIIEKESVATVTAKSAPGSYDWSRKYRDTYSQCDSLIDECSNDDNYVIKPEVAKNPEHYPGEMGKPYLLTENMEEESKRRFSENMFDIVVSDHIALDRAMPDIRNDQYERF
ncbi:unnamed protein product [Didymodactylos carnosus]|uniref:Uncharacterized protein n=1 Tax=Didymodactylos carnosus TaxID=1234261 RepID=A0A8S2CTG4_9BILA|nr:unnamed protein product [Didymodactylos carnosus]CAF3542385.1 unnamed protein product [Didymodactylos carnosus]